MLSLFVSVLILGLILKIIKLQSELAELRTNQNRDTSLPSNPYTSISDHPVFGHHVQSSTEDNQAPSPTAPTVTQTQVPESYLLDTILTWLKVEWMMKIGALLVLMGSVWFLTYVISNQWIGEGGQITIGLLAGAGLLAWGVRLFRVKQTQGEVLLLLGSALCILSTYVGRTYYLLYNHTIALGMYATVSYTIATLSMRFSRLPLAILGLFIAAIAPFMTASPEGNPAQLLLYSLVIVISYVWLAQAKRWQELAIISWSIALVYTVPIFLIHGYLPLTSITWSPISAQQMAIFRFVAPVYTILFWGLSLIPQIHRRHVTPADAMQTVCNGAYVAFWTFALFPPEYRSLILVSAALFFFLTAHGLIHRITVAEATHLYPLTAISLLLLATLAQFEGNMLLGALAVEACVLLVYSYYIRKDGVSAPVNSALFLLFAYLGYRVGEYYFIIDSYSNAYYSLRQSMFSMSQTSAIITHSIVSAALFFPYVFLIQRKKISESGILSICHLSAFVGGILSLLTYSHLVHYTFSPSLSRVADVFVLVSITLIAIYMYAQSHLQSHWYGRKGFSLMLIVYVLIRLFFVEMVTLTTELRMIVFIAIGILFMLSVKFMAHEKQSPLPH